MANNTFSVGRDCQLVVMGPYGRIDLTHVTSFEARQMTAAVRVDRIDGSQLAAELNELRFDKFSVKVVRGADLNLQLTALDFTSPIMHLTGKGQVSYRPGVPIDLQLTAGWLHYLDTLKSIVRTHTGVVAIEDTALARKPDLLLVENWSMPSQSLVLRSRPGDGVVAPFRWYAGWSPFPPESPLDLGSYAWRD
mgnify:CR=1 FL=1